MSRVLGLQMWRTLYSYRLFRWTLWSVIGIIVADQAIVIAINRLDLLPKKVISLPFQDIPESQTQTLWEVLYMSNKLRETINPILRPEDATPEQLAFYDTLLKNIETRADMSWLVFEDSGIQGALQSIANVPSERSQVADYSYKFDQGAGIPLSEAEQTLADEYDFYNRADRAVKHFKDLIYTERAQPDRGSPEEAEKLLPPIVAPDDGSAASSSGIIPKLSLTDEQTADAQFEYDWHKVERERRLAYLRQHPPKPMGWAPTSDKAWKATRQVDIDRGDLHGNPHWKPLWGTMRLSLVPFDFTPEGDADGEGKKRYEKLLHEHVERIEKTRKRKEEYVVQRRDELGMPTKWEGKNPWDEEL